MDNNINFRGGFLIKKPSTEIWNGIQSVLPRKKCVFQEFNAEGDKFFAIKDCHDAQIARYILDTNKNAGKNSKNKIKFQYYPEINLKTGLDTYFPEEARKTIDGETQVIKTNKKLENQFFSKKEEEIVPIYKKYRWKENDHISQTLKALKLKDDECKVTIENGITMIYDLKGNAIAAASPNGHKGINFVYEYSRDGKNSRKLAVDRNGEIIWEYGINEITDFQKFFERHIRIDKGRNKQIKK